MLNPPFCSEERPDATLAFADVAPNTGLVPIFSLTSEPLVNSMVGTINMTAYFSAYLVPQAGFAQPTQCESIVSSHTWRGFDDIADDCEHLRKSSL